MAPNNLPTLRWGILGTGWMSTMFTKDLLIDRSDAQAVHRVVAIGSSSIEKGSEFVSSLKKAVPTSESTLSPKIYDSYQSVSDNPDVDIVYVGTPHTLHKRDTLQAIAAGKHVLCEKPMAINAKDAAEMVEAARANGVFLMEAVWTRFFPVFQELQKHLYDLKTIGEIQRVFVDYGSNMPLSNFPPSHRLRDPKLGAGTLLDIGIYAITWASVALGEKRLGSNYPKVEILCADMDLVNGVDETSTVVLKYGGNSVDAPTKRAVLTTTLRYKSAPDFCTIQGTNGSITVFGAGGSIPAGFKITPAYDMMEMLTTFRNEKIPEDKSEVQQFARVGGGWYYEADAVAIDISKGRTENDIMPLDETMRIMRLMDDIRQWGGVVYPQDQ